MRRASWFFRFGGVVVQRSASESAGASGAAVRRDQPTAVSGPPLVGADHWNVGADLSVPGASHRSVHVLRGVRVSRGELGRRDRLDPVLVEELRDPLAEPVLAIAAADDAARVGLRRDLERSARLVLDPEPPLVLAQHLVRLDVLAVGEAQDATGLVAVQDELAVPALQAEAESLGDPEPQDRPEEDEQPVSY